MINIKNAIQSSSIRVSGFAPVPTVAGVVDNSGGAQAYNAFPYPDTLLDNSIITGWKRSIDHASAGPYMMARSTDGGATWTKRQITVGGIAIQCAALSLGRSGNYIVISYQDDTLYTSVKFARCLCTSLQSNFAGADFTACGSYSFLAGYSSSPYGRPLTLPSGKILQPYYSVNQGINTSICGLLVSSDNGASWSLGATICNNKVNPVPVANVLNVEPAVGIVVVGASDAATKLVCYMRNNNLPYSPSNGYYTQARSTDGGATWTVDNVNYMYQFGNNQDSGMPIEVVLHNSLVYLICGNRRTVGTGGYALQYCTIAPASAITNTQAAYSGLTTITYTVNASTNGAATDFGYPISFHDYQGKLWVQFYDTSPVQNGGDRDCEVYQIKIVD